MSIDEATQGISLLQENQRCLDTFLVDNPELEELNARLSGFNLFDVLQVSHVEIRHSNVLAWLLTPDETHGLGALFLRRLLSRLLMDEGVPGVSMTASKVELMPLGDIEVHREWGNIDILVYSRSHRWCLLIENKIHAKESKGQLLRYIDKVKSEFEGCQIVPVFLTLEGEEPSGEAIEAGYVGLGYPSILYIVEKLVNQNISRIPEDAQVFLSNYLEVLRRLTMQDEQLVDLCKEIYRKHRKAIDLIVSYGSSSQVLEVCTQALSEVTQCKEVKLQSKMVWFLPYKMAEEMPTVELVDWNNLPGSYPLWCWADFNSEKTTIRLIMEVGPIADSSLRIRLLKAINAANFEFRSAAYSETAKFTRIVSLKKKIQLDDNGENNQLDDRIEKSFKDLWKKFWQQGEKIIPVLRNFDWSEESTEESTE